MTAGILDPSPATSGAELNTTERDLIARIDGESKNAHTVAKVAAVLGASLFVYRMYMRRRLREEMKTIEPEKLPVVAGAVFGSFLPGWVNALAPAVLAGYLEGQAAVRQGKVPHEYLVDIAESYAKQLGEHINDVSYDAMMQGFHAQVNRRVPARRAVENVISAYGVPPRAMNALVKIWTGEDTKVLTNRKSSSKRDQKAASLIERAFKLRTEQFGETEAWTARSAAKQLVWMYGIRNGTIPADATRVWRTARDERVCPACGPLDKAEVPIQEPFITDSGTYWSPPLHPKCRCDIDLAVGLELAELAAPSRVGKALGDDPFDRDRRGRFAHRESRLATSVARPDFEPEPVESPEEAWARIKAERAARKETKAKLTPVKLGGTNLKGVKLGASLKPVEVQPAEATPAEEKKPKKQKKVRRLSGQAKLAVEEKKKAHLGLQLPSVEAITIPESDLRPTPAATQQYQRLDQPVYGITEPEMVGADILTGPSDQVYLDNEVDEGLLDYWLRIKGEDISKTFTHQTDDATLEFIDESRNIRLYIDIDTYRMLWDDEISGRGKDNNRKNWYSVEGIEDEESVEDFYDYNADELLDITGIRKTAKKNRPVVYRMDWGIPGEADIGAPGRHGPRYNPGKWQVQEIRGKDTTLSDKPFRRAATTPVFEEP